MDVESVIRPGIDAGDDRACNSLSGVTIGNYFTPMIPKLQDEVQNTIHIIQKIHCSRGSEVDYLADRYKENKDYSQMSRKTYEISKLKYMAKI